MRIFGTASVLLLTIAPAFAAGADKDGDGRITRAELTEVHATLFEQFDRNRDGVVDMSEGDAHFLDIADFNRDGRVTLAENGVYAEEAAAGDLANCDANGDEALSGDEVNCITSSDSFE
jgi:hypothetical protein